MRKSVLACFCLLLTKALAVETTVNQGTPGTRGPWPVTGTVSTTGTVYTLPADGGVWPVSGTVYTLPADGGVWPVSGTVYTLPADGGVWPVSGNINLFTDGGALPVTFAAPQTQEFVIASTGTFAGKAASIVYVLGKRTKGWNATTDQEDVAQYLDTTQSLITPVSTATTYFIRSSNAADTAAGTGVRTVRVVSLDSAGAQQVSTATMSGLTGVSLGSGFSYFQWMESATTGTGGTSAGDITISSVAGAPTTAQTVEYMAAGGNRSFSARYKVPTGMTAYIINWSATMIGGADMDVRLRATVFEDTRALSSVFHYQSTMYLAATAVVERNMYYLKFPGGAELKVSAITSAVGVANKVDASFKTIVIND